MATYLDDIVAYHRRRAGKDTRTSAQLEVATRAALPPRGFQAALAGQAGDPIAVIAEIKRRSPSRGDLAASLDPVTLAEAYRRGGAACLSVLTDGPHFGGSPDDLALARGAVDLPVLRKDFTVCRADVYDARAMGADAILLIAAALSEGELAEFAGLATELGLDALVEVHDEAELERALQVGATLVGVNQRDLHTFSIDREVAARLAPSIPAAVVSVVESGVRDARDVAELSGAGYDAVLVGETLVTSADPAATLAELRSGSPSVPARRSA